MLRSLRLRNFRSLRDTGDVELRPIVLLTGANSSGKSSFLRFFPLVRQTVEKPSQSPLLWYRRDGYVDFGDFASTLSRGGSADTIEVSGAFEWPNINPYGTTGLCRFTSTIARNNGHSEVRESSLSLWGDTISIRPQPGGALAKLALGGQAIAVAPLESSFRQLFPAPDAAVLYDLAMDFLFPRLPADLQGQTPDAVVTWAMDQLDHGSTEDVRRSIEEDRILGPGGVSAGLVRTLQQSAFIRDLDQHLERLHADWQELGAGVRYIGPFRSAPARFYRKEEIPVDEIAVDGGNLAMFLHSLEKPEAQAFSSWVREHFGFGVSAHVDGAHVVLKVEPPSDERFDYNLVDMGFGISQLLPVVAQCWLAQQATSRTDARGPRPPSLLAIEQPELHLHPHHQVQLADMFTGLVDATRAAGQHMPMLIETHSEAMIHRFGELVEARKLRKDDILVLFFEKAPGKDVTTVRQANFTDEGVLENWPIGFFRV